MRLEPVSTIRRSGYWRLDDQLCPKFRPGIGKGRFIELFGYTGRDNGDPFPAKLGEVALVAVPAQQRYCVQDHSPF